jgi:hypothetical protein
MNLVHRRKYKMDNKNKITSNFYYLQIKDDKKLKHKIKGIDAFYRYIIRKMKNNEKGFYQIRPNLTIVVK